MGTVVCVKHVKQEAEEEWDENMPLPGDIIEGFAESNEDLEKEVFVVVKAKGELSSLLGKASLQHQVEVIWVKVRRGENVLRLRTRIAQDKCSMLQRRFTIVAAADDRHIAVLGDLNLDRCLELQEMSRTVVNSKCCEFNKKGVRYDWRAKVDSNLPDRSCTVISSNLFMPLRGERTVHPTTTRCMAWFNAALSSGVPLVFVNIQTELFFSNSKEKEKTRETFAQGVRLWFLPGIREALFELKPEQGEERFGMDIKRTEEGFIYLFSVTKGSAADRAGLCSLFEEACGTGYLLTISRLEGKSVMPSSVCTVGLINCCDHNEIRDTLVSAIDQMESIRLHVMAWPRLPLPSTPQQPGFATLKPPSYSEERR